MIEEIADVVKARVLWAVIPSRAALGIDERQLAEIVTWAAENGCLRTFGSAVKRACSRPRRAPATGAFRRRSYQRQIAPKLPIALSSVASGAHHDACPRRAPRWDRADGGLDILAQRREKAHPPLHRELPEMTGEHLRYFGFRDANLAVGGAVSAMPILSYSPDVAGGAQCEAVRDLRLDSMQPAPW